MKNPTNHGISHLFKCLLTLLTLVLSLSAFAEKEAEVKDFLLGDSLDIDSSLVVFDNKSFDSAGTKLSAYASLGYVEYSIQNTVYLELDEYKEGCFTDTFSIRVQLKIESKDSSGTLTTDTIWLDINYDTTLLNKNKEIASYIFENGLWTKVTILDISDLQFKEFIRVGQTLNIERYRDIASTAIVFNTVGNETATNEVKFSWNSITGAEEYDLEWTWVDAFNSNGTLRSADSVYEVDFRHDATRVTIKNTYYSISKVYEQGYLVARVRPVGRNKNKPKQVTTGDWSSDSYSDTLSDFTANKDFVSIESTATHKPLDEGMNWQYESKFTEEGKRREVVNYYDGSMRSRQSVTRSTSLQSTVGESFFDFEGRLSINVTPAPSFDYLLSFHSQFNLSYRTGKSYQKTDFDSIPTTVCGITVSAFKNTSGASKYYSANNSNISSEGHIPNAEGYPMTVTEYMPDGSGRIMRQGGVGSTHQLGSGHETKYYYATPNATELDRLFGNAVGDSIHYQKEMIVDANGQASLSYRDLSGNIIATALTGDAPDSMSALSSESTAETNLNASFASTYSTSKNAIWVSKDFLVSGDNSLHKFNYGLEVPRITDSTMIVLPNIVYQSNPDTQWIDGYDTSYLTFCYDCVYELTISLKDECGEEQLDGSDSAGNQPIRRTIGIPGQDFDVVCDSTGLTYHFYEDDTLNNDTFLSVYLDRGKYTLSKTLKINYNGYEYYLKHFLDSTGKKTLADFENEYMALEDTLACEISCDSCLSALGTDSAYRAVRLDSLLTLGFDTAQIDQITASEYAALLDQCQAKCNDTSSPCETYYLTLLYDVMIGGQYGSYQMDDFGYKHSYTGYLDDSTTSGLDFTFRKHKNSSGNWVDIDYLDLNDEQIYVEIDGKNYKPNELSRDLFIQYFDKEWAHSLVVFHPEYCKYTDCVATESSFEYDREMANISSFKEAFELGYLDPLGQADVNVTGATLPSLLDPFFDTSVIASDFINDYYLSIMPSGYLMAQYCRDATLFEAAVMTYYWKSSYGTTCPQLETWLDNFSVDTSVMCDSRADAVWEMYKVLYLSEKQKFFEDNDVLCTPTVPDGYIRRFTPLSQIDDTTNIDLTEEDGQVLKDTGDARILVQCDTFCENQANYWLEKLGACNLSDAIKNQLVDTFKVICKNGCDTEHPQGAINTPSGITKRYGTNYNSFEEAFNDMVSIELREAGKCDVWRIASPRGYNSTLYRTAAMKDSCMEESSDTCYTLANEATKAYLKAKAIMDRSQGCDSCISCEEFYAAYDTLGEKYGGIFYQNSWGMKEVLTNYMNFHFGFNLTYWDYADFMEECSMCKDTTDTCYVTCPVGYSLNEETGYCEKITDTSSTYTGPRKYAIVGDRISTYSMHGTKFYENVTNRPKPISTIGSLVYDADNDLVDTLELYETSIWKSTSTTTGRLNIASIWTHDQFYDNKWVGFSKCINVEETKVYHIGLAADNIAKFKLNGEVFFELDSSGVDNNFKYWHVVPVTLTAGMNIIEMEGLNFNYEAAFAAEIYDATKEELISITNTADLEEFLIFSTKEMVYDSFHIAPNNGYTCPTGFALNTCDSFSCTKIERVYPTNAVATLCNRRLGELDLTRPDPCKTWKKMRANSFARLAYDKYRDSLRKAFKSEYYSKCMQAKDTLDMNYNLKEYHYTLYYYDRVGNLIQTVPPEGVNIITDQNAIAQVKSARYGIGLKYYPAHSERTSYTYNSLNEVRRQESVNSGVMYHWYDRLGRLIVSQNAEQAIQPVPQYTYTEYDGQGRIISVGQIATATEMSSSIASDTSQFNPWLRNNIKTQITRTQFDVLTSSPQDSGFLSRNCRNRVVSISFFEQDDTAHDQAVYYDYDIHGNVRTVLREIPTLHNILQGYKTIDYDYDLVSGKIKFLYYQKGYDDEFSHKYLYDAENRLTSVMTSSDMLHWDEDATYNYYLHGTVKRTEIGELKVQGVDYAYTHQGWLKGVNSNSLDASRDIGQDGHTSGDNSAVARDVFGYSLHYYDGDYKPINGWNTSQTSSYFLMLENTNTTFNNKVKDLYNGNISGMATALAKISDTTVGKAYEYDQLNRIKKAYTISSYSSYLNQWLYSGTTNDYYTEYSYDANGNITSLNRNAEEEEALDRLTYHYLSGSNKLDYVDDTVHEDSFSYDIDDQYAGNYTYDEIGNLTSDRAEEIDTIEWTVYGKIKRIVRSAGSTKPALSFEYSPDGYRVAKHVTDSTDQTTSTWYIRDASGNILSTYTKEWEDVLDTTLLDSMEIYDQLVADQTYNSVIAYLDQGLNWINYTDSIQLDSLKTDLTTNSKNLPFLHNFSAASYMALDSVFADVFDNHFDSADVVDALRNNNFDDQDIVSVLCDSCIDSMLTHLFNFDYAAAMEHLQAANQGMFDHLLNSLGIPPVPPFETVPKQAQEITVRSSVSNTITLLSQYGHDCDAYEAVWNVLIGFDNPESRTTILSLGNVKDCIESGFTKSELSQALEDENGITMIWEAIFLENPLTEASYVADIRKNKPQQFLYYAYLELQNATRLRQTIKGMTKPSYKKWLSSIESHFGPAYYHQLLATLIPDNKATHWQYRQNECHIYGSTRVGLIEQNKLLVEQPLDISDYNYITENGDSLTVYSYVNDSVKYMYRGCKRYEMTNHLGDVLAVITDRKIQTCGSGDVIYYEAQIVTINDYYPFGMKISERSFTADVYRFGFNGKEEDTDGLEGGFNTYNYGYRIYNPAIGRFLSVDPLFRLFAWNSPYAFSENRVIDCVDLDGKEKFYSVDGKLLGVIGDDQTMRVVKSTDLWTEFKKNQVDGSHGANWDGYAESHKKLMEGSVQFSANLFKTVSDPGVRSTILFSYFSPVFKDLADKVGDKNKKITHGPRGDYIVDATGDINIRSGRSKQQTIMALTHEFSNSLGEEKLKNLKDQATAGTITKDEFIMGKLEVEAQSTINQIKVAIQLGVKTPFDGKGDALVRQVMKGEVDEKVAVSSVQKILYDHGKGELDGKEEYVRVIYGKQYDDLQSK